MKKLSVFVLAGALAACSQNAPDETTTTETDDTAMQDTAITGRAEVDQKVMAALAQCKQVEPTCGEGSPAGYFVFPDVTTVALGIGGSGGEGALVQNGQIVDYYKIGEGSIGLQAGIEAASYVFKVSDQQALQKYMDEGQWSIGASADITIAEAGAAASAQADNAESVLYVFNSEGLMGDVSVNAMKIWKWDDEDTADTVGDADTMADTNEM